ncbi:hypothetical protein GOA58_17680 [Sinorhizobium meliloti]|uniref:hypothetical protein n=1 Tax=Rhizobium meliloti TaxID=382 RepID=UPI00299E314C|nr:hypothetical protein [Sinorhizobium meliloti]MDW9664663.1 hypothetical protein [Sinorhizobium meliloti]MDX0054312.1 hypothetical protein [Sinorhizobium meliloti]
MATREELYAKFGITAEAGQLFETELGTLILCCQALEHGWHVAPDGEKARAALDEILHTLKSRGRLEGDLEKRFASALKARNRLNHGFYERHNFKIQTDEGRDAMMVDLESLHEELFQAWRIASAMTSLVSEIMLHDAGPAP